MKHIWARRRVRSLLIVLSLGLVSSGDVRSEGTFRLHVINADSTYSSVAVFDVDRDGRLDIYCGGWWYRARGWERQFVREVPVIRGRFDGYSHLPLDVDGDGWTDIVSANYRSQRLYWVRHPATSDGAWQVVPIAEPGPMETARLHDIDDDGHVDVLPNGVRFAAWWELLRGEANAPAGDGLPAWARHDLPPEVAGHGVGFGDIDGDGRGDVVGPRGWLRAPEDRRKGTWEWKSEFRLHRDASVPILVVDVDRDGDADVVWARGHDFGIYWLEQRPGSRPDRERTWELHAIDTETSQNHAPLWVDLDGDGREELVTGRRFMAHAGRDPGAYDPLRVASYQFAPSARTWRRQVITQGRGVGFGLDPKAIDLDGDGDVDLLCPGRSGLYWLENLREGVVAASGAKTGPQADEDIASLPAPDYADHSDVLVLRDTAGGSTSIESKAQWGRRRAHVLAQAERMMGPLPGPRSRVPLDVREIGREETPHYVRVNLTYRPEPGDRVPALLLLPRGIEERRAALLCLHQTTPHGKRELAGLAGRENRQFAHELAVRGYICLVPDYPSFGDYEYDFGANDTRYASGTMKAIWNNIRALDLLEARDDVDPDRIGVIGHSLGGHNGIFTAVFDRRIAAVVTSCGFTAFHNYYDGDLRGWTSDRYMPRIRDVYDSDPDRVPVDFYELIAAIAPRPLFVNAPLRDGNFDVEGVRKVVSKARDVYRLLGAGDRLEVVYPDSAHDFPGPQRKQAYEWLDRVLGHSP